MTDPFIYTLINKIKVLKQENKISEIEYFNTLINLEIVTQLLSLRDEIKLMRKWIEQNKSKQVNRNQRSIIYIKKQKYNKVRI